MNKNTIEVRACLVVVRLVFFEGFQDKERLLLNWNFNFGGGGHESPIDLLQTQSLSVQEIHILGGPIILRILLREESLTIRVHLFLSH